MQTILFTPDGIFIPLRLRKKRKVILKNIQIGSFALGNIFVYFVADL